MGLRPTQNKELIKLIFKYQAINNETMSDQSICIHKSFFSMDLQNSNYIQIDNDLMYHLHQNPEKVIALTNLRKNHIEFDYLQEVDKIRHITDQVYFKYKSKKDVQDRRGACIQYKA